MTAFLHAARAFYAEEIRVVANLRSPSLVDALAHVPREDFLGPGPWDLATADPRRPGSVVYTRTPDANPRHVYHNVLVAIDRARELNNGQPATLAAWLDLLNLQPGESFVHIGCGTGYYTALAAAMVGPSGRVVAIEIDAALAARAARNLSALPHVSVAAGDATAWAAPDCDAILVNAGFTHAIPAWLDAMNEGGRLLLPVTAGIPGSPITSGAMFLVTREAPRFRAEPLMPTAIFGSPTGRADDLNTVIRQAFAAGNWLRVKSVRRDRHAKTDTCCIHGDGVCLSQEADWART
jgi:protein-L-isoaspartate(D-aspartate) O-methyltransferase